MPSGVSFKSEVRMRRVGVVIGWCFFTFVVLFLAVATAGEIRQRVLVHRASALLADIHAIHLHESDWHEAQRLRARWGLWGHYDGVCTAENCMFVISLKNESVPANQNVTEWASGGSYFLSRFRLLPRQFGGGLRLMDAMFLVEHGKIVRSGVSIDMTISPFAKGAEPVCCGAELLLSAHSQASLGMPKPWAEENRGRHPDYITWRPGGCMFCLLGRVTFADSISSEEAARLSDFQLSCATRWSSCLTLEELDPAAHAWHLYGPPWGDSPESISATPATAGCTIPLYALGRDATQILSVQAVEDGMSSGKDANGVQDEKSRVKVLSVLKGNAAWPAESIQTIGSSGFGFQNYVRMPVHLVKNERYLLLLGDDDFLGNPGVFLGNCGIIPDSAAGKQEVMRGAGLDDKLTGFEPTISFEGFSRHERKLWDH